MTPVLIAPLTVLRGEAAEIDEAEAGKQPDWTRRQRLRRRPGRTLAPVTGDRSRRWAM